MNDGEVVAELEFVRADPPWRQFSVRPLRPMEEIVLLLKNTASREPNSNLIFRNRQNPKIEVRDEFFFTNIEGDDVRLRDLRVA